MIDLGDDTMSRILIIEDEKSILRMIEYDLKQLNYEVDTALDGLDGYKKASALRYDVILLDLMLPKMNGMEVCEKLRNDGNTAYIIMLTAIDDENIKIQGLDIGADDYVTKPFSPRELSARIKVGLRRQGKVASDDVINYGDLKIIQSSYEVYKDSIKIELTLKEFELLVFLLVKKGKALSRDQLLNNLWGYNYDGDSRVVDVHIFKLREKLDPKADLIKTVRGIGYKIV